MQTKSKEKEPIYTRLKKVYDIINNKFSGRITDQFGYELRLDNKGKAYLSDKITTGYWLQDCRKNYGEVIY